jgi:hypothetical protein
MILYFSAIFNKKDQTIVNSLQNFKRTKHFQLNICEHTPLSAFINVVTRLKVIYDINDPSRLMSLSELFDKSVITNRYSVSVFGHGSNVQWYWFASLLNFFKATQHMKYHSYLNEPLLDCIVWLVKHNANLAILGFKLFTLQFQPRHWAYLIGEREIDVFLPNMQILALLDGELTNRLLDLGNGVIIQNFA